MYQSTAKSEQFHGRTGNDSTKGSRKGYTLLGEGVCPTTELNDDEKMHNLKASLVVKLKSLEVELAKLNGIVRTEAQFKKKAFFEALSRRDALKIELLEVTKMLSEIKISYDQVQSRSIERNFVDICNEILPSGQFKTILAQAIKRTEKP